MKKRVYQTPSVLPEVIPESDILTLSVGDNKMKIGFGDFSSSNDQVEKL